MCKMKLSVVIPCYNESQNIPLILNSFSKHIHRNDIEIVLVDNGSFDDSDAVLQALIPDYPFARTVKVQVNCGYGHGILKGLSKSSGEYLAWTHADLQTSPADPIKALEIVESMGDPIDVFVKGNRSGRSLFDTFFTIGMSFFETLYLKSFLWDINAQPTLFRRSFFESWSNPPSDFSLDLYALYSARRHGLKIIRFPVSFPPRIHGESSWNTGLEAKWKFIKRTMEFSVKLKKGLK